jgi:DNA-binding response OmpR family regulator
MPVVAKTLRPCPEPIRLRRIRTNTRKERKAMPKKILIIDDDPTIVKYLMAVFSDNGYATCSASSSTEGLDVVIAEKPDLICLDLQMPGEWGPRFYRKLRKDKAIIVVSGIDGDHAIKDAVAFVKKPFDPEKLIGIVKNTIG